MSGDELEHGRLLSPVEAEEHLGIPASTVRTWHHRRERTGLYAAGLDRHGKPLFYEADLLAMKLRRRVRDKHGRRHHTMREVTWENEDPDTEDTVPGSLSVSSKGQPTCHSLGIARLNRGAPTSSTQQTPPSHISSRRRAS